MKERIKQKQQKKLFLSVIKLSASFLQCTLPVSNEPYIKMDRLEKSVF